MKKYILLIITICLCGCSAKPTISLEEQVQETHLPTMQPTMDYTSEEWFDRYDIYNINTIYPSSHFYPYDNSQQALKATRSALDEIDHLSSKYIKSLNGEWLFYYTTLQERLLEGKGITFENRHENWDTSNFDTINVPSTIQTIKDENGNFKYDKPTYTNSTYPWLNYEPIQYGWDGLPTAATASNMVAHYKKYFNIEPGFLKDHTFLSFEGVLGAFYVYVNGNIIGYNEDSCANTVFDITPYIHEGENTIAVEVMKYSDASFFENQDAIRTYGIFRDVEIITRPKVYITDIETKTSFNSNQATLNTYVDTSDNREATISLYDNGIKIAQGASMTITNPHLWDTDDPYLYQLLIEIYRDGQLLEATSINIGFRNITWDNDNVYINGRPIIFKGVNRTETSLETGRCISKEEIIYDLQTMKDLNINAFRTAHYPNQKITYDLADELGLFVIDECNIESHLGEQVLQMPANNPIFNDLLLQRTINMVERDLNHPSIIIYSLGNESTYDTYPLNENYGMYQNSLWILNKDPSRLRMYERDNRYGNTRETSMVDIASSQYFSIDEVKDANKKYDIPFVQQEFAHAMGNAIGNLKEYYDLYYSEPGLVGGFIWDFVDQSILTNNHFGYGIDWDTPLNDKDFCGNGILNADRTLQAESFEVKKVFQYITFKLLDDNLIVSNYYRTKKLDNFTFKLTYYDDGNIILEESINLHASAYQSSIIEIKKPEAKGELTLLVQAFEDVKEVAFEQFNLSQYNYNTKITTPTNPSPINIEYDDTIDISYNGITLRDLTFNFYRPPVSNDPQFSKDLANIKLNITNATQEDNKITLKGKIKKLESDFTIILLFSDNQVQITSSIHIPSIKHIGEIARVGLTFKLPNSYNNYTYYGEGPFENYVDRNTGSKLGIYNNKVDATFNTKYLKPQDSGNHSKVRYVTLHGSSDDIRINMDSAMNINITNYNPLNIANANHFDEVYKSPYTIVNIDYQSRGLGNASLDVQPLEKYLIQQNHTYEFKTLITFMED